MKIWILPVFLALGFGSAVAHDPPNYPRALIGHVSKIVPEGVVVEGVAESQIHPQPGPGVDHECFAGVGGPVLVTGLRTRYKVGDQIEIMVTEGDGTYLFTIDATQQQQIDIWNMLSESLAFGVGVDWDPSAPASAPAGAPAAPATAAAPPSASKSDSTSSNWTGGSIDDPIPGAHK